MGARELLALARYGRLSSFHTYLSKLAANVLGVFVGILFVFGFEAWLFYVAIGATVLASVEELALLAVLRRLARGRAGPVVGVARAEIGNRGHSPIARPIAARPGISSIPRTTAEPGNVPCFRIALIAVPGSSG